MVKVPKYTDFMIDGYYLYFTSKCVVEAMHVHASDKRLSEKGSAKFWVKADGSSVVQHQGRLSNKTVNKIQKYIALYYQSMYQMWLKHGGEDFYRGE